MIEAAIIVLILATGAWLASLVIELGSEPGARRGGALRAMRGLAARAHQALRRSSRG